MALNFPDSPGIGSVFTDATSGFSWEWTGAVWKSFTPAAAQNIKNLDDISGSFNNSTQTFNLTINGVGYYPRAANLLQISLGGIIQEPDTDYTVDFAAGTITFTTAPDAGLDFFGVVRGTAVAIDYANNGNVQNKQNYTATAGQTAFTFSAGYNSGYLNVYRNGVKLRSTDFTETSSTVFTLNVPAQQNDEIEAIGYVVASIVTTQGNLQNLNVVGVATIGAAVTINNSGIHAQSGIITATSFVGNLTGTATGLTGTPDITVNNVSAGVVTATSFVGNLTGTAANASGLTGTPDITVNNIVAAAATFSGNVSIAGTLTYEDVTNVDSIGIITARSGLRIDTGGLVVTAGVSTLTTLIPTETRFITVSEKATRIDGNTVNLTYNSSSSNIGFATNPSADITLNVTGIPETSDFNDHVLTFSVFVNQTGTARTCTAVTLNGVSKTINWAGGSLSAAIAGVTTTSGTDIYTFTGINTVGSASTADNYRVLGMVNGGFA